MHLLGLSIERIRAIERLSLDLSTPLGGPRRRAVLLGANGAGKTTVLSSIAHVFSALSEGSGVDLGARRLTASDVLDVGADRAGAIVPQAPAPFGVVEVEMALSGEERSEARRLSPDAPPRGSLRFDVGADRTQLETLFGDVSEKGQRGASPFFEVARSAIMQPHPPCLLLPAGRGILGPAKAARMQDLLRFDPRQSCLASARRRFVLVAARLAFATLDPARHDPLGTVARMWKVITSYFPELPRPVDAADPASPYQTQRGSVVPLESLSDGERALLLVLGEIALRPPHGGVLLIDEPEQHLHPRWQRVLLEALPSLVPTAQIIYATQSPFLAACAPDDVIEIGDWKRDGQ